MTNATKRNAARVLLFILPGLLTRTVEAATLNETAVMQAVERVVTEHKVYATCLSLEPTSYRIVQENWTREVNQGAEALKSLKPSPALVARFVAAVNSSRLIDGNMALSAAMTFCQKNEAQVRKFHEFGFSRLAESIHAAAKSRQQP